MCGICGILNLNYSEPVTIAPLKAMSAQMTYRGPDDSGEYLEPGFGMASRRLSILDLSPHGHMPMSSPDGRYWIVQNGEIYNFAELREDLQAKGYKFRSSGDTEVLLYLYIIEGPAMLSRLNGMFALAIWDSLEKRLFLARDRLGVKPLYYVFHAGRLFFASEEKCLFAAGVPCSFDENTWEEMLFFRYVAGERTPYRDVQRLLPGYYLVAQNGRVTTHSWWSLRDHIQSQPVEIPYSKAVETFTHYFDDSIRLRRISDVPVGALLSGGLDSGSMVATMSSQAGQGVETFTMRFSDNRYDEGDLAAQVARQWNTKHHEVYLNSSDMLKAIEEATFLLDEPVIHGNDPHILAISRYAKDRVTVLLSGEGADEILGGYVRYRPFYYEDATNAVSPLLPFLQKVKFFSSRFGKLVSIFSNPDWRWRVLFSSAEVFPGELGSFSDIEDAFAYRLRIVDEARVENISHLRQVMYYEQHTYLQSILDRNDRMTMGASIECREPFLDYRLVEWAFNLPPQLLFRRGAGKWILRESMRRRLPPDILKHKKWGFGVPWVRYLREVPAFRFYLQNLPWSDVMRGCPIPTSSIRVIVQEFLAGQTQHLALVRQLFMTALWYDVCIKRYRGIFGDVKDGF